MIQIEGLSKTYGRQLALDQVSLEIQPGDFFGLLGPNGAGKSTMMHILTGFIEADSGSISCGADRHALGCREYRAMLGFVPQHIALYQECTARENLNIFGGLSGLSGAGLKRKTEYLLEQVKLTDRADEPVGRFSGGMQRRLNLAIGILHDPQVLLCDEPTVGVDPQSRNAIFELLEGLNRKGMTIVYTTHYMEEVQRMCNRIGIIDHGKLIALGTLNELLDYLPYEEEIRIDPDTDLGGLADSLRNYGEIVKMEDGGTLVRLSENCRLSSFFSEIEQAGLHYRHFRVRQPSLEALFLHLTGRTLRD